MKIYHRVVPHPICEGYCYLQAFIDGKWCYIGCTDKKSEIDFWMRKGARE